MEQLTFNKYIFGDNNKKLGVLDEFNRYYGFEVFKNGFDYILMDNQSGEIEFFNHYPSLVLRICGRALDYYCEEQEWDDNKLEMSDYIYILQFIFAYEMYSEKTENVWLKAKKTWLKDMEVTQND